MKRIARFTFTLAFFSLVIGVTARADDYYWTNPGDGDFDDPANWNHGTGGAPGETDVAIVDTGGYHSILFWLDPTTDRALVRSGFVSFTGFGAEAPYTYTLLNPLTSSPGLVIGHGGRDVVRLTVSNVCVHAINTSIGHLADATGRLSVYGALSSVLTDEHLTVGNEGIGTLETLDGATITSGAATVGLAASAFGEVILEGAETLWTGNGPLTIGKSGDGVMTLSQAATANCHDAIFGQVEDSTGAVTVTDDAQWTIDGTLDVGMTGFGSLLIEDGASVTNHTFATIGTYDSWPVGNGGVGEVTVDAHYDDASWTIDGDLYIGFFGEGTLSILGAGDYADASVAVSGDVSIGLSNPGTLWLSRGGAITIGGHLSNYDQESDRLVISLCGSNPYPAPAIYSSGTISDFEAEVVLSYEPQAGDTFAIAHADEDLGAFSFILPDLPEDLQWHVIQDEHDVSLAVVPTLTGDINGDGVVNTEDLLLLLAAWGDCPGCPEDLNGDGVVNTTDLLMLLANWG